MATCLVIGGGAMKGIKMLGALASLYENEKLGAIHSYAGSSIGALLCSTLALGISPVKLQSEILGITHLELKQIPLKDAFTSRFGLYSNENLFKTFEKILSKKYGKIPTFQELNQNGTTLYITAINLTLNRREYLSHKTYPEMNILQAVQISCTIPGVFEKISYNGHLFIDGGIVDNFPISCFDEEIARGEQILGLSAHTEIGPNLTLDFKMYMYLALSFTTRELEQSTIERYKKYLNVKIYSLTVPHDFDSFNFNMSTDEKNKLYMSGYKHIEND